MELLMLRCHCKKLTILFFFFSFLPSFSSPAFTPNTSYLLNCGSSSDAVPDNDSRTFVPDSNSNSNSFSLSSDSSTSVTNPNQSTNSPLLYQTARVFTTPSSYQFHINTTGTHLVRLHFYPFATTNYNLTSAVFNVSALGSHLLLANFTVAGKTVPIIKEYLLWVESDKLVIQFVPSGNSSLPFAFVSALEVFTAPNNLIPVSATPRYITSTGLLSTFSGNLSNQAMEMVYRINVGGQLITPFNDTLSRSWIPDAGFLYQKKLAMEVNTTNTIQYDITGLTREIAPDDVYNTAQEMNTSNLTIPRFNISWVFNLSSGYKYFVRMHFCDFMSKTSSQLYFNVFINNQSAYPDLHPSGMTYDRLNAPFYVDFVIDQAQSELMRVTVGRSELSSDSTANAILNGLEIMKVNNSVGSLDGDFNPLHPNSEENKSKKLIIILVPILGGLVLLVLLVTVLLLVRKQRKHEVKPSKPKETQVSWSPLPVDGANSVISLASRHTTEGTSPSPRVKLGLHISFDDIMFATNGFDENLIVGTGGFGKVYKGVLRDGTEVAVKRCTPDSRQGYPEFQTEIMVLSQIRHRHLVSLIGYCEEHSQMILVYEYMEKGTLKNYLYGLDLPCLSWKQRLEICIGAARGIHYLHTGFSQGIIHRDVKTSNILLGEDYLAKVSDFGLSRLGPSVGETHVSTVIKGTFGYLDPEYFKTQQLTDKSDVYSFGVVLFEVLCARPVINPLLSRDQHNLCEWAMHLQRNGLIEEVVDPRLKGKINSNSLRKFGETAEKCLADHGEDRPTIGVVLWNLEYALQLQETELNREPFEDSGTCESEIPVVAVRRAPSTSLRISEGDGATETNNERSDVTTSKVFSQLMTNEGR